MEYIRQKIVVVPLDSVEIEADNLAAQIESKVDFELLIAKLPDEKQQKIAIMIGEGYTTREVSKELKVSLHTIKKVLNQLKSSSAS